MVVILRYMSKIDTGSLSPLIMNFKYQNLHNAFAECCVIIWNKYMYMYISSYKIYRFMCIFIDPVSHHFTNNCKRVSQFQWLYNYYCQQCWYSIAQSVWEFDTLFIMLCNIAVSGKGINNKWNASRYELEVKGCYTLESACGHVRVYVIVHCLHIVHCNSSSQESLFVWDRLCKIWKRHVHVNVLHLL